MLGLFIILATQVLCEGFCRLIGLQFPGSVLGMLVLSVSLIQGWIPKSLIQDACAFLQRHMVFFFLPAGVACLDYLDLLHHHRFSIIAASVLSTVLVQVFIVLFYDRSRS